MANDDPVAIGLLYFPESGIRLVGSHKSIHFLEGAIVEKYVDPLPGGKFAFGMLFFFGFFISLGLVCFLSFQETCEVLTFYIHEL